MPRRKRKAYSAADLAKLSIWNHVKLVIRDLVFNGWEIIKAWVESTWYLVMWLLILVSLPVSLVPIAIWRRAGYRKEIKEFERRRDG